MNQIDWSRSQYKHQLPAIEMDLKTAIAENGSAPLVPIMQKFLIPMLQLRNLVEAHQEQWGLILNKPTDLVYLRKEGEAIAEQVQELSDADEDAPRQLRPKNNGKRR